VIVNRSICDDLDLAWVVGRLTSKPTLINDMIRDHGNVELKLEIDDLRVGN
jgi:hypothetical protein